MESLPPRTPRYPSLPAGLFWLRLLFQAGWALAPAWTARRLWQLMRTPRRPRPSAWEARVLCGSQRRTVSGPVGPVVFYEWGERTHPAVVLVHGWEQRAAFWGAWIQPLLAAGYRVVALDAPAHGASAGRQVGPVEVAEAVRAVMASLSTVHALIAHSFGAASVAGVAGILPAGQPLPHLILLSAPPHLVGVVQRFTALFRLSSRVVAQMAHHFHRVSGRRVSSLAVAVSGPRLRVEHVLLLHDEQDPIVPVAEARQLAAAWPAAQLVLTQGLGHNRILREPSVVQQAVAFLGSAL